MVLKIIIGAVVVFLAVWAWKIRIYLKWQKKAKANVAPFYRWPASVHELPEQKEKLRQAKEEQFSIHFQDEEKGLARIKTASDPKEVWCSLGMCQCAAYRDDKPQHKPCKHIYKIALNKGLIQ